MVGRIEEIRKEEKEYHDYCYDNYKLFVEGSWLYKPVKTVMDLMPKFLDKENVKVLDLGCGVGRNSIPIADKIKEKNGRVVCVDLLDSALNNLRKYSLEYGVDEVIDTVQADIGNFNMNENEFDLIIAVSSLEHVSSEKVFEDLLARMANGTKIQGINCLILNSDVEETECETNRLLEAQMEINLSTENIFNKLTKNYDGWEVLMKLVKPLEYMIARNGKDVLLKTNAITYIVCKR